MNEITQGITIITVIMNIGVTIGIYVTKIKSLEERIKKLDCKVEDSEKLAVDIAEIKNDLKWVKEAILRINK